MVAETLPRADFAAWLSSQKVIRADGAVMSWVNREHAGYPYPEIAGYLLSDLSFRGRDTAALRNRVARRLLADMTPNGAVGRRGVEYVFDSAMVLAGLLAHESTAGLLPDPRMPDRLRDYITDRLNHRSGLDGTPENAVTHWSQSYGCHLLKSVISLTAFDASRGTDSSALINQLLKDLLPLYEQIGDGGRFHVNADSDVTYTHAHCYAIEGLLVLEGRGNRDLRRWIEGGAEWLASVQESDGGVPAEHDSNGARMKAHADCTAQAVRVWACTDARRYRNNIKRGVAFLTELSSDGGVRYESGSNDINTWATIFGAQAIDFATEGGRWQCLI
jgi:hypothetical protein